MRKHVCNPGWLSVGSAVVWLAMFAVSEAQASDPGVYFRGGIGPALAHETDIKEFLGPTSGLKVKYDPGLRVSVAGGYQFCRFFSGELETGVIYNSIKSITTSPDTDASVGHVPVLCNAVFYFPFESRFVPYWGIGAGGVSSVLDINHATIRNVSLHGDDADVVWAAQAFAGFRYEFNDQMGVGFGYKFLATGQPRWDVTSAGGSGGIEFDHARTHSFLAEFTLKF